MSAHAVDTRLVFEKGNIELAEGSGRGLSALLTGLGGALIGVTIFAAVSGTDKVAKIALHAYQAGFMASLAMALGALGFTMIFHQTNAGWVASIRRQFENLMSIVWVGLVLFVVGVLFHLGMQLTKQVYLFEWMNPAYVEGDKLYEHKSGFLNVPFFYVRAAIYFVVWLGLSQLLWSFSTRQDQDGDKWHTVSARKLSAPGLLLFAFTTAFAGFDWVMSLDFHWFSTMFGVYYFAGAAVSCLALVTLTLIILRGFGRLHVAFTEEHLHDLSKLLFAFTVFWAYISFSQYFLIWYANIPEETAWMLRRKEGPWEWLSWTLPIGHFIVPFVFLISRPVRRSRAAVALGCLWLLGMHLLDLYWAVRPEVWNKETSQAVGPHWVDIPGILGPFLVFLGMYVRRVASGPLMPLHDPRLPEALVHKNYV
ncbi:MAG: quinol:cytochrome C oxidoreductase [Planctomycetota bacterium]|nr:quinol:cytochrome C oxidoreductase [Planctomycetota bacterium]